MQTTTHYGLQKPDPTDTYNKATDNSNMDAIDAQMYANAQASSNAQTTANAAIPSSQKGAANGVATLDPNSKLTSTQLPIASATIVGGVKQGTNITISADGTISGAAPYTLPQASGTVLGGVKIGTGITEAGDGTISVTASSVGAQNFTKSNTAPTSPSAGDKWYDTTVNREKYWNGTAWVDPLKLQ